MKKILFAALVLMLIVPAALAEGLSLPDFGAFAADVVTFSNQNDDGTLRLYECNDVDALVDAIVEYFLMLEEDYGLGGFDVDDTSSETFVYMYAGEYYGAAAVSPQYIDNCAVPCYVLIAVTGQSDGSYLAAAICADGVDFDAATTVYTGAKAPVVYEDGTVLADPITYANGSFICAEKTLAAESNDESDWYSFHMQSNDAYVFDIAYDYVQELVDSGFYEIIDEGLMPPFYTWELAYNGNGSLREIDEWMLGNTDLKIYIKDPHVFAFRKNPDITFVEEHELTEDTASYEADTNNSGFSYSSNPEPERNCMTCSGSGKSTCSTCGGSGQVYSSSISSGREACYRCNGLGRSTCSSCNGSGKQ